MRPHVAALVLAGSMFLPGDAGVAQQASERATYTFYRNGAPVGRHTVDVATQGSRRSVRLDTQVAVQLADRVVVFRYTHRGTETWDGDRLVSMETQTDDNGNAFRVVANANGGSLVVKVTAPEAEAAGLGDRMLGLQSGGTGRTVEQVVPANVLPTSWWNPRVLEQTRLLNSQYGTLATVSIQLLDNETVRTGLGPVQAKRYRLSGGLPMDIWYDSEGRWVKSRFRGRDGSTVEVVRER
jgi:hypothetical protein